MKAGYFVWLLAGFCLLGTPAVSHASEQAKIKKVLPHLIDREGRHTLSPSLYERDAYQAHLRKNPQLRAGLRFDVQWNARKGMPYRIIVELRGSKDNLPTTQLVEKEFWDTTAWISQWSFLVLRGDAYRQFGDLTAWRVTLWQGNTPVAEQSSFLW